METTTKVAVITCSIWSSQRCSTAHLGLCYPGLPNILTIGENKNKNNLNTFNYYYYFYLGIKNVFVCIDSLCIYKINKSVGFFEYVTSTTTTMSLWLFFPVVRVASWLTYSYLSLQSAAPSFLSLSSFPLSSPTSDWVVGLVNLVDVGFVVLISVN